MNKTIRDEWVARLRSGEYEQGRGNLRYEDKFCCLGVLCDLAADHGIIPKERRDTRNYYKITNPSALLPSPVYRWAEVSMVGEYAGGSVARDNDEGKTFAEIADIIERNF